MTVIYCYWPTNQSIVLSVKYSGQPHTSLRWAATIRPQKKQKWIEIYRDHLCHTGNRLNRRQIEEAASESNGLRRY